MTPLQIIIPLLLACASAVTKIWTKSVDSSGGKSAGWWLPTITDSFVVVAAAIYALSRDWKSKKTAIKETVEEALRINLLLLADSLSENPSTRVPSANLSVHVFRLRGIFRKRLIRFVRRRPQSIAPSGKEEWRKGEGVVGMTWANPGTEQIFERSEYVAVLGDSDPKAAWDRLDEGRKMGVSYQVFQSTASRYSGIMAVPITKTNDEGRISYWGCISLGVATDEEWLRLKNANAIESLRRMAATVEPKV